MARISLDHQDTALYRLGQWYSRRRYGAVLDPGRALWHNRRVLWAELRFEQAIAKFDKLDPVLKHLAVMAAAARIGCSWCLDFGTGRPAAWASRRRRSAPCPAGVIIGSSSPAPSR